MRLRSLHKSRHRNRLQRQRQKLRLPVFNKSRLQREQPKMRPRLKHLSWHKSRLRKSLQEKKLSLKRRRCRQLSFPKSKLRSSQSLRHKNRQPSKDNNSLRTKKETDSSCLSSRSVSKSKNWRLKDKSSTSLTKLELYSRRNKKQLLNVNLRN